jgi:alpha-D-ribose 1-methylphosphonate 5-triphosphate diphosphatase
LQKGLRGDMVRVGMLGSTPLVRGVWSRGNRVS